MTAFVYYRCAVGDDGYAECDTIADAKSHAVRYYLSGGQAESYVLELDGNYVKQGWSAGPRGGLKKTSEFDGLNIAFL